MMKQLDKMEFYCLFFSLYLLIKAITNSTIATQTHTIPPPVFFTPKNHINDTKKNVIDKIKYPLLLVLFILTSNKLQFVSSFETITFFAIIIKLLVKVSKTEINNT